MHIYGVERKGEGHTSFSSSATLGFGEVAERFFCSLVEILDLWLGVVLPSLLE